MNPNVRRLLREVGINVTERTPRLVTPGLVATASKVVTFGCLDRCPMGAEGKGEDWPFPGAAGKAFEEMRGIRDELSRRIDVLIENWCVLAEAPSRGAG